MQKKFLRRFTAAALALNVLNFTPNFYIFNSIPVACAQVEIYEGVGEYIMSKKETPEFAEKSAKEYALRNAQEKAGFFLKSSSIIKNNSLEDEIMVVAANIVREVETVPELIPLSGADKGYIKCRVAVKVQIDTDKLKTEIDKLLKRDSKERADLIEKNKLLQKMLDDANKRNADLEKLISNAKTSEDNQKITSEISMVMNDAQIIEKITESNQLYYKKEYDKSLESYRYALKNKVYEGTGFIAKGTAQARLSSRRAASADLLRKITEDAKEESLYYLYNISDDELDAFIKRALEVTEQYFEGNSIRIKARLNSDEVDKYIEKLQNERN